MSDDAGGSNNTVRGKRKDNIFTKIFGGDHSVTEQEILRMVDEGEESGAIKNEAKSMIENIFSFDDTSAGEIMTHRTEMTAVEDTDSLQCAVNKVINSGYSRIPVFHKDIDNIVGALYAKDLLKYVCKTVPDNFKLTDITRDVMFVPKSKNCSELFAEMISTKKQLAIVVDDYGGTEGLITMEDLIEAIVGNIQDEYDNEEEDIKKLSDKAFTADGSMPIEEVEEIIGETLSNESDEDTLAGYILDKLGHIPKRGEKPVITVGNITFTVTSVEDRRIARVLIVKK